jgi:hypothetical protein
MSPVRLGIGSFLVGFVAVALVLFGGQFLYYTWLHAGF